MRFENRSAAPYAVTVSAASLAITLGGATTPHTITTTIESLPDLLPLTEMVVPVGGASFQLRAATITPSSGACGGSFCADAKVAVSLMLLLGDVPATLTSLDESASCAF